jgi:hypothetical protein
VTVRRRWGRERERPGEGEDRVERKIEGGEGGAEMSVTVRST